MKTMPRIAWEKLMVIKNIVIARLNRVSAQILLDSFNVTVRSGWTNGAYRTIKNVCATNVAQTKKASPRIAVWSHL